MKYEREVSSAAAALGRLGGMKGGKSRSAAKVAAVRENGRKGGRPKGSKNKAKVEDDEEWRKSANLTAASPRAVLPMK